MRVRRVYETSSIWPIDSILAELRNYIGGPEGWRRMQSIMLLESPEILHAASLAAAPTGYTLSVEDQDGATREVELSAQKPKADKNVRTREPWSTLEAKALADAGDEWVRSMQIESDDLRPLYLRQTDRPYWYTPLENDGGYLRMETPSPIIEPTYAEYAAGRDLVMEWIYEKEISR